MPSNNLNHHSLSKLLDFQIGYDQLSKHLDIAISLNKKDQKDYFSVSYPIQNVDPLAVIEQNSVKDDFEFYWEKPSDNIAMCAGEEISRIKTTGRNRFKQASGIGKQLINKVYHLSNLDHSKSVPHLFGGFSFFDHNVGKNWSDFGAASFTLPKWSIIKNGALTLVTVTIRIEKNESVDDHIIRIEDIFENLDDLSTAKNYEPVPNSGTSYSVEIPDSDSPDFFKWKHTIDKATHEISQNKYEKIVLARKLNIKTEHEICDTHILNRLRNQYPDCYSFLIRQNEHSSFIGCTPERLASFNKDYILTEGLAGSTPRGETATEDARLEAELLTSKKDLEEHKFVVNAITKNLNSFADNVEIPKKPSVKKLTNVQHLYTPIRAHIKENVSKTQLLNNLHPTPAVGGYPREEAISNISRFEGFERGWYASPIGWINANGNGEFIVGIRSGLIKKEEVIFYAGCGIVSQSDPLKEWEETNLKFIPMLSALEYARR